MAVVIRTRSAGAQQPDCGGVPRTTNLTWPLYEWALPPRLPGRFPLWQNGNGCPTFLGGPFDGERVGG